MKSIHTRYRLLIVLALLVFLPVFPARADAPGEPVLPPLEKFLAEVMDGDGDALRGIYAPGVFAYSIIPQPDGDPVYVSTREDTVTQFALASRYDSTGLLAHNFLAGNSFSLLEDGQLMYLIYGDGRVDLFVVSRFMSFRALTPNSVTSKFVDLETGDILTASQLFLAVYDNPGHVVLQTCIYKNGESSWGRLFIIAEPIQEGIVQASSHLDQTSE